MPKYFILNSSKILKSNVCFYLLYRIELLNLGIFSLSGATLVQPKREKIRLWGFIGDIAKNRLDLSSKGDKQGRFLGGV